MTSATLRAVLRIARRDALRARGRTVLIVAMIALPVLGMTAIDVLARTAELDRDELITRELGRADAKLPAVMPGGAILQDPTSLAYDSADNRGTAHDLEDPIDVAALLPAGSRVVTDTERTIRVRTTSGVTSARFREFAYGDPLVHGVLRQRDGRAPRSTDEVALSPRLLTTTGLRVGDRLRTVKPDREFTIVGTVVDPDDLRGRFAVALPGALLDEIPDPGSVHYGGDLYVDMPHDVTWREVLAYNAKGVVVLSRVVLTDPPPREEVPWLHQQGGASTDWPVVAVVALIVGLAALEVVLLAGTAFAVGARRQARSLALVAATGGEPQHVRAVVLAGGLVLGTVGAAVGVALGAALAFVARPSVQQLGGAAFGRFDVRPLEVLAIAALGMATGVAAAILPARAAARQDVVAVLAGRRGVVRVRKPVPVLGVFVAAAGAGVAALGATRQNLYLILAGAVVAQLGLIVTTPALVGGVARLAGLLPLAPRLALRDAARHRSRSAPAVAAVMAAVSGSVALSAYIASDVQQQRESYQPAIRPGDAFVYLSPFDTGVDVEAVRRALAATLPARDVVEVRQVGGNGTFAVVTRPPEGQCPLEPSREGRVTDDPRCALPFGGHFALAVGDAAMLHAFAGTSTPEAERALRAGGIVVFDRWAMRPDGTAPVEIHQDGVDTPRQVSLPATYLRTDEAYAGAVASLKAVARLGLSAELAGLLVSTTRMPTGDEEEAAAAALEQLGISDALQVERGFVNDFVPGLIALVVGSAMITLGAAGIVTGLAQADSRPDHATLAAVGAPPGVRRRLAMAQAATVAVLGTTLGVGAGLVPALAYLGADPARDVVLPWPSLTAVLVVVPLLAALCAAVFTRSRLPLQRRIA